MIPPVTVFPTAIAKRVSKQFTTLQFELHSGDQEDGVAALGFGLRGYSSKVDTWDVPKPISFNSGLSIGFVLELDNNKEAIYLSDYRGALGDLTVWKLRCKNETGNQRSKLRVKHLQQLPLSAIAALMDKQSGWNMMLDETINLPLSGNQTKDYEIIIGAPENVHHYIQTHSNLNTTFQLNQITPNPVKHTVQIRYNLPAEVTAPNRQLKTSIFIYTPEGKRLKNVYTGMDKSGWHTVQWSTSQFPSGLYFYRLSAGSHQATKAFIKL